MIHRFILLVGIAFALAVRVAVPSGWMPAPSGDGGFLLVPCAAAQAEPMAHGGGHSNHHEPADTGSSGPGDCAFAPLQAGLFWIEGGSQYLAALAAYPLSLPVPKPRAILLAWPAAPPPATGPPPAS